MAGETEDKSSTSEEGSTQKTLENANKRHNEAKEDSAVSCKESSKTARNLNTDFVTSESEKKNDKDKKKLGDGRKKKKNKNTEEVSEINRKFC